MKILIDAFPLTAPKSGVGYYTYHLLKNLQALYSKNNDFTYFYGRKFSKKIAEKQETLDIATRAVLKNIIRNPYRLTQPVKELIFKVGSKIIRPDIYHETNYILLPYSGPQIVTVFDMSIKRFPETHPKQRVTFFNKYFDKRIHKADHILAISEFTKQEIIEFTNIAPNKITVTPLAPHENFHAPNSIEIENFKKQKQLPNSFFLYLGNIEPRKNLLTIVRAFEKFSAKNPKMQLVLAGEQTWLSESVINEIKKLKLASKVMLPGYVDETELPLWYASATAFLYPSKYEGFGLPVVESMTIGTPVITSNVSSLPEVAGNAAVLLSPDDIDAWSETMTQLSEFSEKRIELKKLGIERAKTFSWKKCAKSTFEVYKNTSLNL